MKGNLNFYKKIKNIEEVQNFINTVIWLDGVNLYTEMVGEVHCYNRKGGDYGFIEINKDGFIYERIAINSVEHIGESYALLIDTLAHEYAHIFEWNHDKGHTRIKNLIKKVIKARFEIYYIGKKLEALEAC